MEILPLEETQIAQVPTLSCPAGSLPGTGLRLQYGKISAITLIVCLITFHPVVDINSHCLCPPLFFFLYQKTVRLMVNYHGSQKAVVRVNPLVPLQALIPVICDKCEFDPAHVLLLRDSTSRHELPLDKSLAQLEIKELYVLDQSLCKISPLLCVQCCVSTIIGIIYFELTQCTILKLKYPRTV